MIAVYLHMRKAKSIIYIANIVIACYYEFAKVAKHFIKFVERGKYESVDFSRRIRNEIGSYNG